MATCLSCHSHFYPRFDKCYSVKFKAQILNNPADYLPGTADFWGAVPCNICVFCTTCHRCRVDYWKTLAQSDTVKDLLAEDIAFSSKTPDNP